MWNSIFFHCQKFHTTSYDGAKTGHVMKKIMGYSSKKKRVFSEPGILPSAEMFSKGSYEGKYSGNSRRISVLNKLFMRYITDLLATGEYSSYFTGRRIEINRVQVSSDYNGLNVFWVAKGSEDEETIDKLLKKNAGFLRHELSSLRVMGNVPRIYFVKDKQQFEIMHLDYKLAEADFGDNYVHKELGGKLKSELEFCNLSLKIKEKITKIDEENDEVVDDSLLTMPQDVFGLNHINMLNRMKQCKKKTSNTPRFNSEQNEFIPLINRNPISFNSNSERREAFKEFLEKRELLRSKARKMNKKYYPDMEYIREEIAENLTTYLKNLDIDEDESGDFVIENIDNEN